MTRADLLAGLDADTAELLAEVRERDARELRKLAIAERGRLVREYFDKLAAKRDARKVAK